MRRQRHRSAVVVGVRVSGAELRRRRDRRADRHQRRARDADEDATCCCASPATTSSTRSGSRSSTASATQCPAASIRCAWKPTIPGIYSGSVHRVLRPQPRPHAHGRRRSHGRRLLDLGRQQLAPAAKPTDETALRGEDTFRAQCSRCHQVNGLMEENPDGTNSDKPVIASPDLYVVAGNAPNLTHLMTRTTFAGATFDLLTDECRDDLRDASPEEFGALYLQGVTPECFNEAELREWIRNAPAKKPMYSSEAEKDRERREVSRHAQPQSHRRSDRRDHRLPARAEVRKIPDGHHRTTLHSSSRRRRRRAAVRHSGVVVRRLPPSRHHHRLAVVAVHRRPQEARPHVRRRRDVLLPRRRHRGVADPHPAGCARQHRAQRQPLQPDVHDARHDDDLPVRDADGGRLRQLPRAAADRCARRRLPPAQRLRLLVLPVRRHLPQHLVVPRRCGRRRLVHVPAERQRPVLADPRCRLLVARLCRSPASPR